jgi:hypothetical protein
MPGVQTPVFAMTKDFESSEDYSQDVVRIQAGKPTVCIATRISVEYCQDLHRNCNGKSTPSVATPIAPLPKRHDEGL